MARTRSFPYLFPLLLLLAGALRLMLIPNPGFEADISFWKSWGLATVDRGIVEGVKITNNNYPTPFAYALGAMVWIYQLFQDPHNFREFWTDTNLLFLTISKLFPIIADFGIAGLILFIGKQAKRFHFPSLSFSFAGLSFYEILAVVYVLNPLSLIDGAWWGQVDAVGVVIFLGAVVLLLSKKPFLAGAVFILSMMTKLQNMIYGPLFFLLVWQLEGLPGLVQSIRGAVLAFVGLNIQFILSNNTDRVLGSLTENYDYFPWMSLIAYNLWWIVSGARGLSTSDKLLVIGMLNAKTVGLIIFSLLYLFASVRQYLEALPFVAIEQKRRAAIRFFLESLVLVNGAFFLFQTQSHDRYAFPLSAFLLLLAPYVISDANDRLSLVKTKLFSVLYLVFTLFYFYNLHTALSVNYPQNGLPILSRLTDPTLTIFTSFVLLGLFAVFLLAISGSKISRNLLVGCGILFVGSIIFLNAPLLTKHAVFLTKLTPYISEQAYGTRQTNRSVQSSYGTPYQWQRLSSQYLFYENGIGSHANSRYVYDIGGLFSKFTTDFGIDTEAGDRASVVFEIYGDDRLLFRSEKLGRYDLPKHADVSVSGVKRLTLKINDAGDGNYDDHADWLNPKLWP